MNESSKDLFIIDGEVILGAKQNRISQRSVILEPFSETILPVYCIERGRWQYRARRDFASSKYSAGPKMRAAKNLNMDESHRAQSEVWDSVSEYSAKINEFSQTDDLNELLDKNPNQLSELDDTTISGLNCNGFIVAGAGRPFIEIFFNKKIFKQYVKKSIHSWLADQDHTGFYTSPNYAVDEFVNSLWRREMPIGKEVSFFSQRNNKGRAIFLGDKFVHGYCFL